MVNLHNVITSELMIYLETKYWCFLCIGLTSIAIFY